MNGKQREVLQEILKRTAGGRAQVLVSITRMRNRTHTDPRLDQRRVDGIQRLEEIVAYQARVIETVTDLLTD